MLGGIDYPVVGPQGGWVSSTTVAFLSASPTVAGRLFFIRRALRRALQRLQLQCLFCHGIDLSDFGIFFPLDGLVIGVEGQALLRARAALGLFVPGRRVTSHAAFARPL